MGKTFQERTRSSGKVESEQLEGYGEVPQGEAAVTYTDSAGWYNSECKEERDSGFHVRVDE